MVVGTAASMDGYTAYGASITKDGNKQTFDCPAPLGMVLDPSISAAAPARMSASGYADLIAKIPAGADWMLSDAVGSEPMDDFAFGLVQDGLKEALSDPAGVHAGNVEKVEQLAEGLLLSGFAMQATQSSRPASGAEHQFSHLWDMEHLKYNGASVSHGFKVGIGHAGLDGLSRNAARRPRGAAGHREVRRCVEIVGRDRAGHPGHF